MVIKMAKKNDFDVENELITRNFDPKLLARAPNLRAYHYIVQETNQNKTLIMLLREYEAREIDYWLMLKEYGERLQGNKKGTLDYLVGEAVTNTAIAGALVQHNAFLGKESDVENFKSYEGPEIVKTLLSSAKKAINSSTLYLPDGTQTKFTYDSLRIFKPYKTIGPFDIWKGGEEYFFISKYPEKSSKFKDVWSGVIRLDDIAREKDRELYLKTYLDTIDPIKKRKAAIKEIFFGGLFMTGLYFIGGFCYMLSQLNETNVQPSLIYTGIAFGIGALLGKFKGPITYENEAEVALSDINKKYGVHKPIKVNDAAFGYAMKTFVSAD